MGRGQSPPVQGAVVVVVRSFLRDREFLVVLAVLLALATAVAVPLAVRAHRSRWLAAAAGWSVAAIVAFTAVPSLGLSQYLTQPWSAVRVRLLFTPDLPDDLTSWASGPQGLLNAALFVPAGLLLTALTRRPGRTVAGLVVLSLVIEVVQAASATRSGTLADVVANLVGAALGALVGFGLSVAVRGGRPEPAPGGRAAAR